ncbi:Sec-independent protein translocase subunit TatA/TatB [Geothermobacter hydrogeniphilus]|uniref:Sec-independent protein translocase protein TatA n=1 Tax=Geothermobacter hydrogeniphilus TaxID=1969733 RepID=A0A1X0YBI2_9BACT|nr:twin-arginine translocase TatA/TatE family subunit [Geothermobacter hydrogeniphilus]ORJ62477.1 hypothetical protein B5V00_04105 [Geothermobacter hydrogeniphilus]
MFGLGWMEIGILVLILVLVFGPGRAGAMAGKIFGTVKKVDEAKRSVLSPTGLLERFLGGQKPADKPEKKD